MASSLTVPNPAGGPWLKKNFPQTVETKDLDENSNEWANLGYWLHRPHISEKGVWENPQEPDVIPWPPKTYSEACQDLARIHADYAGFNPHQKLLDIACGRGASVKLWAQEYGITGIDVLEPCNKSMKILKATFQGETSNPVENFFACKLEDILGNIKTPPNISEAPLIFNDEKGLISIGPYDRIVCIDSAYHFSSTHLLLEFARKTLKQGGMLVWSNFTYDSKKFLPPLWLSLLKIRKEAMVDLSSMNELAAHFGFEWHAPFHLNHGVIQGFPLFVEKRRCFLSLFQKLSTSWLTIHATAVALKQLTVSTKVTRGKPPPESLGYAVMGVSLR